VSAAKLSASVSFRSAFIRATDSLGTTRAPALPSSEWSISEKATESQPASSSPEATVLKPSTATEGRRAGATVLASAASGPLCWTTA
jgi:hypothetical protein